MAQIFVALPARTPHLLAVRMSFSMQGPQYLCPHTRDTLAWRILPAGMQVHASKGGWLGRVALEERMGSGRNTHTKADGTAGLLLDVAELDIDGAVCA